jgi:hypothetical protein
LEPPLDVDSTTFRVYLFLVKEGKPLGPRDVMRGLALSSPSVAYRHLKKLQDLQLIQKDDYGHYLVDEKLSFKGYVWVGNNLLPRLLFYSFFFLGLCIVSIATVLVRLMSKQDVQPELILLTSATGISTILFMIEGTASIRRCKDKS